MVLKRNAPYGHWESPISIEAATAGTSELTSPRTCPHSRRAFFLVSTPDGANTIVEVDPAVPSGNRGPRHVLPDPWRVGTSVYEYGGLAYAILPPKAGWGLRILFSDPRNNACYVLDVDTGSVVLLLPDSDVFRYGDFHVPNDDQSPWALAVQEDHTHPQPAEVRNHIVGIHTDTGEVVRIVTGADFYSYPRFSPVAVDGYRISWRQWEHPYMSFDGATLYSAVWNPSARHCLTDVALVAGENGQCIGDTAWAPDGSIVFGMERMDDNYRQLFRARPFGNKGNAEMQLECIALKGLEDVEFGDAGWLLGSQTFIFLTKSTMVAVCTRHSKSELVYIDLTTYAWAFLDIGLVDMGEDPLAPLSASSFLVTGSSYTSPTKLYRVELNLDRLSHALGARGASSSSDYAVATSLYASTEQEFNPKIFSTPNLVRVPVAASEEGAGAHETYGWFWPPRNLSFTAPANTLPPLIITPHGGPTGCTAPGLDMVTQFWATRGFAVFAINYSGSTGHGRAYRNSLWARWGLLDRDDTAAAVAFLVAEGRVDGDRVGIIGGSAGGYNVLQSLVSYSTSASQHGVFTAGVCASGVADTAALASETHKLESHYISRLLFADGTSAEEQKQIHQARSPLFHAERITAPLLLVHGDHDPIVPIAQSRGIRERILARGGDVELVVLPGEGHIFTMTKSKIQFLKAQEVWWKKTLLT